MSTKTATTAGNYFKPKPSGLWVDEDFQWYILQAQNTFEEWCVRQIWQKLLNMELHTHVKEMVVPKRKTAKMSGKKTKIHEVTLYPTYIYINMKMSEELWDALVHVPRVINFVGYDQGVINQGGTCYTGKRGVVVPTPLAPEEVEALLYNLKRFEEMEKELQALTMIELGDIVQISNGGDIFDNEVGAVRAIRDSEVIVRISNYGSAVEQSCLPSQVRKLTEQEIIEDNFRREADREGRHVNEVKRKYGMEVPLADDEPIYFDSPKVIKQIEGYVSSPAMYHHRNQFDGATRPKSKRNVKEIRLSTADTQGELQFQEDEAFFSSLDDLLGGNDDITEDLDLSTPTKVGKSQEEKSQELSDDEATYFSTLLDDSDYDIDYDDKPTLSSDSGSGGDFLAELDGILDQTDAGANEDKESLDLSFADGLDAELSSAAVQNFLKDLGDDFLEEGGPAPKGPAPVVNDVKAAKEPAFDNVDLDGIEDEELVQLMKSLNTEEVDFENGPSADELQSLDKELENLEVDETELAEILSSLGEDFTRSVVGQTNSASLQDDVDSVDLFDGTVGVPSEHLPASSQRGVSLEGEELELEEGMGVMNFEAGEEESEVPSESKADLHSTVDSMKVPELKAALKSRGLKVGGRKAELVQRLKESMGLL